MSIKTIISAAMLLSAIALPALAEDTASSAARPYPLPPQRALLGGAMAGQAGSSTSVGTEAAARRDASNAANAVTQTDAANAPSVPAFSTNPHIYDHLSGPAYQGGY
jgi:hypothetical protein